jgi:hypothetical protein
MTWGTTVDPVSEYLPVAASRAGGRRQSTAAALRRSPGLTSALLAASRRRIIDCRPPGDDRGKHQHVRTAGIPNHWVHQRNARPVAEACQAGQRSQGAAKGL